MRHHYNKSKNTFENCVLKFSWEGVFAFPGEGNDIEITEEVLAYEQGTHDTERFGFDATRFNKAEELKPNPLMEKLVKECNWRLDPSGYVDCNADDVGDFVAFNAELPAEWFGVTNEEEADEFMGVEPLCPNCGSILPDPLETCPDCEDGNQERNLGNE